MFRGSIFYASNGSLLALWFLEHSLLHGANYDDFMVVTIFIDIISFLAIENTCFCLYVMDAWIA